MTVCRSQNGAWSVRSGTSWRASSPPGTNPLCFVQMPRCATLLARPNFIRSSGVRISLLSQLAECPVTGRPYQRLSFGPAPVEMAPLLEEMIQDGLLRYDNVDFGDGIIEKRPIAIAAPSMRFFSEDDIEFVIQAILYYWDKTGKGASDNSHGVAWSTRENGDPMPYELAYLSDETLDTGRPDEFLNWPSSEVGQVARYARDLCEQRI